MTDTERIAQLEKAYNELLTSFLDHSHAFMGGRPIGSIVAREPAGFKAQVWLHDEKPGAVGFIQAEKPQENVTP